MSHSTLDQFPRCRRGFISRLRIARKPLQPFMFLLGKVAERHFAITPMRAEKVVTSTHCQPHQPMLKRCFRTITGEFLKRLKKNLLDYILHFAFTPSITPDRGENARLVF